MSAKQAPSFYRPELDALRFCAFLMILIHHSFPSPDGTSFKAHALKSVQMGSALGVPLFFMLSAYLITELLVREKRDTGTIHIRDFYLRRILRIWPLYFFCLGLAAVVGLLLPEQRLPLPGFTAYALLSGNWWFGRGHSGMPRLAIALWSVSIEEQFYLIWPGIVKMVSGKSVAELAIAVWLAAQGVCIWLAASGATAVSIRSNSFVQFQYFALGTLIAYGLRGRVPRLQPMVRVLMGGLGLLALFVCEYNFDAVGSYEGIAPGSAVAEYLLSGLAVACILLASLGAGLPAWARPSVALGKISYGLYVYHFAVVGAVMWLCERLHIGPQPQVAVIWAVALPITILIARVSYEWVEKPFLALKKRFTIVQSRAA